MDFIHSIKSTFTLDYIELKSLQNIFGNKSYFFTNNGRTSLYLTLKALHLPKGSKIGVPLYSCTVVFDAIIKAGCIPRFIDIDLDNYTLDPKDLASKVDDLSAVVVIHTFGRPANMDQIKYIAGNVPVIEDCAHSILSEYNGKLTGTLGFSSFFSLKKYLSGGGGMIILNNDDFVDGFQKEINQLNDHKLLNEIINSIITYVYATLYNRPCYGLFVCPLVSHIKSVRNHFNGIKDFKANKIMKSDYGLFFNKLNTFKGKVEHQRKNSLFLLKQLRNTSLTLPYEKKNTYCNYYLFPVRFNNKTERNRAHELLRDMGIDTTKLYAETPLKARKFYGYKDDCSNAEIVADTILTIPNHYTLKEKDMLLIVETMKNMEELL